jgi:hypothetical protein
MGSSLSNLRTACSLWGKSQLIRALLYGIPSLPSNHASLLGRRSKGKLKLQRNSPRRDSLATALANCASADLKLHLTCWPPALSLLGYGSRYRCIRNSHLRWRPWLQVHFQLQTHSCHPHMVVTVEGT